MIQKSILNITLIIVIYDEDFYDSLFLWHAK
jgi:hypothetical protein